MQSMTSSIPLPILPIKSLINKDFLNDMCLCLFTWIYLHSRIFLIHYFQIEKQVYMYMMYYILIRCLDTLRQTYNS
jgi:hypothetical protein